MLFKFIRLFTADCIMCQYGRYESVHKGVNQCDQCGYSFSNI